MLFYTSEFCSYRKQKILVQDMESDQDPVSPHYEASCPMVTTDLPPFSQISVNVNLNGFQQKELNIYFPIKLINIEIVVWFERKIALFLVYCDIKLA